MEIFKYNTSVTYENNFQTWYTMNTYERFVYKEKPLDYRQALTVFNDQYEKTYKYKHDC